jgi:hypothetical protein
MALTSRFGSVYTRFRNVGCHVIRALSHYDVRPGEKVSYSGSDAAFFGDLRRDYVGVTALGDL